MIVIFSVNNIPVRLSSERWNHIINRHPEMLTEKNKVHWDYDEEADVLYLSIDEPQMALGVDMGDGVIVRYKEKTKEIVGLTIIGIKQRALNAICH